jgi:hypothetical protein
VVSYSIAASKFNDSASNRGLKDVK